MSPTPTSETQTIPAPRMRTSPVAPDADAGDGDYQDVPDGDEPELVVNPVPEPDADDD